VIEFLVTISWFSCSVDIRKKRHPHVPLMVARVLSIVNGDDKEVLDGGEGLCQSQIWEKEKPYMVNK